LYACEIKKTTNGGWRGTRRETRKTIEVIAERRIAANGALDEPEAIARVREDQTEKVANEKTKEALGKLGRRSARPNDSRDFT